MVRGYDIQNGDDAGEGEPDNLMCPHCGEYSVGMARLSAPSVRPQALREAAATLAITTEYARASAAFKRDQQVIVNWLRAVADAMEAK